MPAAPVTAATSRHIRPRDGPCATSTTKATTAASSRCRHASLHRLGPRLHLRRLRAASNRRRVRHAPRVRVRPYRTGGRLPDLAAVIPGGPAITAASPSGPAIAATCSAATVLPATALVLRHRARPHRLRQLCKPQRRRHRPTAAGGTPAAVPAACVLAASSAHAADSMRSSRAVQRSRRTGLCPARAPWGTARRQRGSSAPLSSGHAPWGRSGQRG